MDWNDLFSRILSLRTFSNLWYWMAVCVSWMVASHWIIGVPFDMIYNARRAGGQPAQDLSALVDINARRLQGLYDTGGMILVGLVAFMLTSMAVTGFYYGMEVAQGMFFLAAPLTIVGVLNFQKSNAFLQAPPTLEDLPKRLMNLRMVIQFIGMTAIFLSATYGMYFNLTKPFGY